MAEKDITEKLLEEQNDVFADIINTLVFGGKQVIKEEDLESISTLSSYKMSGKLHAQERDVLKAWKQGCIRIAVCGLENQTNVDYDIPLRVIGYDGAVYRAQLNEKQPEGVKRYPVFTLVLFFGKGKWTGPKNLLDRISVPEELEGLVSDYRINVIEIGLLNEETIRQFNSDFQIVADYMIQMQQGGKYKPSEKPMRHLEGVMDLMEALTNDEKYKESIQVLRRIRDEGGKPTMRSAMDEAVKSAMSEAIRSTETRMRSAMDEAVKSAMSEAIRSTETRMRSAMDEAVRSAKDEAVRSTETRMRSAMDEAVRSAKDEAVRSTETRMRSAMDEAVRSAKDEAVRSTETRMRSAMDEAVRSAKDEAVRSTETRMRNAMDEAVASAVQKEREDMAKAMIIKAIYSKDEIQSLTQLSLKRLNELELEIARA